MIYSHRLALCEFPGLREEQLRRPFGDVLGWVEYEYDVVKVSFSSKSTV